MHGGDSIKQWRELWRQLWHSSIESWWSEEELYYTGIDKMDIHLLYLVDWELTYYCQNV